MADTPVLNIPTDPREQPILDELMLIRADLDLLKRDRTTYIKSSTVVPLYDRVVEQVQKLNAVREDRPHEQNRVDRVLDGCFQLLSLFFMTIGKNNEAPAAYALTSTIKRLLDHLTETKLYSAKDLDHVSQTLESLDNIIQNSEGVHSDRLVTLLGNRTSLCREACRSLQERLKRLDPGLAEIHQKCISILRCISLANTKSKFSNTEVKKFKDQLEEIKAQQVDGHFVTTSNGIPAGDAEINELLTRILEWADVVMDHKGVMPDNFKPTYDILVNIRNELEKLSLTQAWSLRETDLYDYQRQLDRIDEARVDGNFLDSEGKPAELYVQRTLLYLIRRSYGYIYYLMVSSEPVSEALQPIYNQLQTLRRCLVEVREMGGVSSPRELYPYSMKLNSIDNMKVDGRFMINGDIPEGQASVNELLAECFDIAYELRIAAESEESA
ncbi:hypothetical protein O988_00248 [Pseudogymnoascus sp. VKM F-3808]|nr:hypothetical protein V490_04452 [Pseudogymnoascus sp. VKM F-3557]KFY05117.1 hypothetical protein O988_00248 [Pseudogymnoascus sp. VKM F-3808]KFY39598.1 hypothetical protein V495_05843 [Pseudogymnoascus sp. VKM F-4514 (FW-929)]KFY53917.1 hypothetical protein V497_08140 [Pseudogymnoascus sp. VKM F-4516 (FW-969)]